LTGQTVVFGKELFFSLNALWIQGNTIYRADLLALGFVVVAHALGTLVGVDHVDLFPGRDGIIGALGFTDITVDAVVGNHQGHEFTSKSAYITG